MPTRQPTTATAWGAALHPLLALALAILLIAVYFWPLPLHLTGGFVENTQPPGVPAQIAPASPGDPLQLMYHFWMFADMLAGTTPWFHNLYEFNTGDDSARFEPQTYYFPFSFFFAIGHALAGHAAGWNLASVLSIALTLWLTFLLARRYTHRDAAAWGCALLAITLPYRWLSLGGGSPTGFTMAWIPLLLLGLDRMVHDRSVAGGALAGLAILLASFADAHCFFFSVLVTPAWFAFAWYLRTVTTRTAPGRSDLRSTLGGGAAIVALFALAYGLQELMTATIDQSDNATGRTLREVGLFTPGPEGLFGWSFHGVEEHIYLGFALAAMVVLGLAAGAAALVRGATRREAAGWVAGYVVLLLGMALAVALALGMNGPFGGQLFLWARDGIPPYRMIRQTAKIYCLLPSLIAVMAAIAYRLARPLPVRAAVAAWVLVVAAALVESGLRVTPRIGLLPDRQGAYAAVAEDARAAGRVPRAVVITLWPGDSHFSSVYQHWVSTYHIRMVNGYFPFVPRAYLDEVYYPLESLNMGLIDDAQIEWLRTRGIDYLLLHEDIYPAKVSPFPVGYALTRLMEHPRLELLAQDGPVRSFRITERPHTRSPAAATNAFWPGARATEAERLREARGHVTDDPSASRGQFAALRAPEQGLIWPGWDIGPGANIHWAFRVRGTGRILADRKVMNQAVGTVELSVASTNWTWVYLAMPHPDTRRLAHVEFRLADGAVDVDMALLMGGDPVELAPGASWTIPAGRLFRAGAATASLDEVVFDPAAEAGGYFMNGPHLPLTPGTYELSIAFDTAAPAGTPLGSWNVQLWRGVTVASAPLVAGQPFRMEVPVAENLPFEAILQLNPFTHAVTVRALTLTRID